MEVRSNKRGKGGATVEEGRSGIERKAASTAGAAEARSTAAPVDSGSP